MKENMPSLTTSEETLELIKRFDSDYANDWSRWLRDSQGYDLQSAEIPTRVVNAFKTIMGKWQACRAHGGLRYPTALESTLIAAVEPLKRIGSADLRSFQAPGKVLTNSVYDLWRVFEDGLCLNGKATELGVSKAILLVTKGRIGPAFDKYVVLALKRCPIDCQTYIDELVQIAMELVDFEAREKTTLEALAQQAKRPAAVGRAVDMVLWQRGRAA